MERDSFIFYKSFYEALSELKPREKEIIYTAICEYMFFGKEPEVTKMCKMAWLLIKPQLDANKKKYENGRKGGRPKTKPKVLENEENKKPKVLENKNHRLQKTKPNEECRMSNENEECRMSNENENAVGFFEDEFGRPLSPVEMQSVIDLEEEYSTDLLKLALKESVLSNVRSMRYVEAILRNWKEAGVKSVVDAENVMKKHKANGKTAIAQTWDKPQQEEISAEERQALIERIRG